LFCMKVSPDDRFSITPGGTRELAEKSRRGGTVRRTKVDEILRPYKEGVPHDPSVHMGDRIIDAIELMVRNNLKCIAVLKNQRPIGIVHLEDAFQKIGLQAVQVRSPTP
jgi:CBS domain-containing protein